MNVNVQQKVEELAAAIRAEVVEEIRASLNGGRKIDPIAGSRVMRTTGGARRPKGAKRTPAELGKLVMRIAEYVRENPGNGVEAMAKALGVPSKELVLPIKKLLADKVIETRGHKRATKYLPVHPKPQAKRRRR